MPITEVTLQPTSGSLNAAYRPVVIKATATRTDAAPTPPAVYCDIYINNIYYKTLEKTQPENGEWVFDVEDGCQELLRSLVSVNGGGTIVVLSSASAEVYCKLRSSGFDIDGFLVAEGTAPVQGTGNTDPVAGTGTQTNTFYVINSALQHANNQNLSSHLDAYKSGTWAANAWPLTHRNSNYQACPGKSDYFPIFYTGSGLSCIEVEYTNNDGSTGGVSDCAAFPTCPIVSGITVTPVDNGDGTQTFTFTWDTADSLLSTISIQYRVDGDLGAFTSLVGSTASGRTLTLPLGLYEFQFQMNGGCTSATSAAVTGQGIAAPACVPVAITGSPTLPDGVVGIPYSASFSITGSPPYSLGSVVKPSWMTISFLGAFVEFSGTPDASGTAVPVSFDIINACGTVSFSDTFDVTAENIEWSFTNSVGSGGFMRILVNGLLRVGTSVSASGSLTVNIGDVISVIVTSTVAGTALIAINGPYISDTEQTHVASDSFTVVAGQYTVDGLAF